MKTNVMNYVEDGVIVAGVSYGIAEIKNILGIVLLVLNICLILYKCIYGIVTHVKNKRYDQIDDEIQNAIDSIEDKKKELDSQENDNGK